MTFRASSLIIVYTAYSYTDSLPRGSRTLSEANAAVSSRRNFHIALSRREPLRPEGGGVGVGEDLGPRHIAKRTHPFIFRSASGASGRDRNHDDETISRESNGAEEESCVRFFLSLSLALASRKPHRGSHERLRFSLKYKLSLDGTSPPPHVYTDRNDNCYVSLIDQTSKAMTDEWKFLYIYI